MQLILHELYTGSSELHCFISRTRIISTLMDTNKDIVFLLLLLHFMYISLTMLSKSMYLSCHETIRSDEDFFS
jgi:hypothetical protein